MGEMFFLGGLLGGAVVCASFTAGLAASKNRSGLLWFLLGLPFGPLALLTVGLMPKLDQPPRPIEESPTKQAALLTFIIFAVFGFFAALKALCFGS